MFVNFFVELCIYNVFVMFKEYFMLMEVMDKEVIGMWVEDFYYFLCLVFVKDERNLDKFD